MSDRLPPVAPVAVASMGLAIAGGITVAARLPQHASLTPSTALLAAAGALFVGNVVALTRLRAFAWDAFFLVLRWVLLAYLVIAGTLEFVFVTDGTGGSTLAVLSLILLVFALDVPLLLAFSVARYQPVSSPTR